MTLQTLINRLQNNQFDLKLLLRDIYEVEKLRQELISKWITNIDLRSRSSSKQNKFKRGQQKRILEICKAATDLATEKHQRLSLFLQETPDILKSQYIKADSHRSIPSLPRYPVCLNPKKWFDVDWHETTVDKSPIQWPQGWGWQPQSTLSSTLFWSRYRLMKSAGISRLVQELDTLWHSEVVWRQQQRLEDCWLCLQLKRNQHT